jgi:hypothetical protein
VSGIVFEQRRSTLVFIAAPAIGSCLLIALFGRESRGRSLRELDLARRLGG